PCRSPAGSDVPGAIVAGPSDAVQCPVHAPARRRPSTQPNRRYAVCASAHRERKLSCWDDRIAHRSAAGRARDGYRTGGVQMTQATRERRRQRRRARPAPRRRVGAGWIVGAVVAAVVVVGGVIWVGQPRPTVAPAAVLTDGKTKGHSSAPVVIDEWGDFQ